MSAPLVLAKTPNWDRCLVKETSAHRNSDEALKYEIQLEDRSQFGEVPQGYSTVSKVPARIVNYMISVDRYRTPENPNTDWYMIRTSKKESPDLVFTWTQGNGSTRSLLNLGDGSSLDIFCPSPKAQ